MVKCTTINENLSPKYPFTWNEDTVQDPVISVVNRLTGLGGGGNVSSAGVLWVLFKLSRAAAGCLVGILLVDALSRRKFARAPFTWHNILCFTVAIFLKHANNEDPFGNSSAACISVSCHLLSSVTSTCLH